MPGSTGVFDFGGADCATGRALADAGRLEVGGFGLDVVGGLGGDVWLAKAVLFLKLTYCFGVEADLTVVCGEEGTERFPTGC